MVQCSACARRTRPLARNCAVDVGAVQPVVGLGRPCTTVLYTALIGAYDDFHAFAAAHREHRVVGTEVCYVALVDAVRGQSFSYWKPVLVRPLFPDQPARSAHLLKTVPFQLFPRAEWIVYIDAKTTLSVPVTVWISRLHRTNATRPLHVLRHPHRAIGTARNGLVREIGAERHWVEKRRRSRWAEDVADIDALAARYCAAAPLCSIGNVVESSLIVWHAVPSTLAQSRALHRLACHWYHEVRNGSQREQLSFPYVVHASNASRLVHYVEHEEYKRHWGWLDHRGCDASGKCRSVNVD